MPLFSRHGGHELPRGLRIVAMETEEELVALLDNDKTRKLSGQYVLLTRRPVRWQILSHPLFKKVRLGQVGFDQPGSGQGWSGRVIGWGKEGSYSEGSGQTRTGQACTG